MVLRARATAGQLSPHVGALLRRRSVCAYDLSTVSWRQRLRQHGAVGEQQSDGETAGGVIRLEDTVRRVPVPPTALDRSTFDTCVVYMLGYPAMGKRTIGTLLAGLLDGVLVDNALINRPVLELFRWDGIALLPPEIWDRTKPILDTVLDTIEDLAPPSNSYVFTNVIEEGPAAEGEYGRIRSLADRRGSLFLAVMLDCDINVEVSRIDNPDRVALRKGSDPEGYRGYRLHTKLFQPPQQDALHLDTTSTPASVNAARILDELGKRGFAGQA